ncbi:MAG TPA: mannitol dehydrogenase family protein [Anaeromyxobacter sp.]|nr:mannitol dehydrogenase family protein [Anaeromyxobacter sp.]
MSEPIPLRQSNLAKIPAGVARPQYDRGALKSAIVHMSVGGFHRAHQAVYLDDLLTRGQAAGWGICGVGLKPRDAQMRDVMQAQDCLFTVVERSGAGDRPRVIGSMREYLLAPDDPLAVVEKMASPECRIVSLTITEGGYFVDQGTGELLAGSPELQHDLAHPGVPTSSFGLLAEALDRRRRRGLEPFTVQSCDNLQGNGNIARKMLLAYLKLRDPALHAWAEEHVAFPNAMVDRIVPVTKDEHRALVREKFGIVDGWPVVCEPWIQWVIEDRFPLGRPRWEAVGAQLVKDVVPYELMKLWLLNASHQAIAYVGMLLGQRYVDEAMADPDVRRLPQVMMDAEVTRLLPPVPGIDLARYKAAMLERFGNPVLRDTLARLGTEASARIPKFVLPSVRAVLARGGGPMSALTFVVASWFHYLAVEKDDRGAELPKSDPMLEELVRRAKAGGEDPRPLLELRTLFGEDLPTAPAFVQAIAGHLRSLRRDGTRAALRRCLADTEGGPT